jgi:hypothetical protein
VALSARRRWLMLQEIFRATVSAKGRIKPARFFWKRSTESYLEEVCVLLRHEKVA